MSVQPLGDRVVVKRLDSPAETPGKIILPDSAREKSSRGTVIAVGPGVYKDGKQIPVCARDFAEPHDDRVGLVSTVKAGDVVLFAKYAANEIEVDGESYLILTGSELLAVLAPG